MPAAFGTSGLRGLVVDLTPDVIACHVKGFIAACPMGSGLWVGRDLRASSPDISAHVIASAQSAGIAVTDCGHVSTPALAMTAMNAGAAAIMVTGSHIPADRNGLKFYTPAGEITKAEEAAIAAATPSQGAQRHGLSGGLARLDVMDGYIARYVSAFGSQSLQGLRLGIYQHSSVARDALVKIVQGLGGEAVPLGRAVGFVPMDTEAVDAQTRVLLAKWAQSLRLDAILSTDGDGDRPLLADHQGHVIAGDLLGVITARSLGASCVCTPVSANSMIEEMAEFAQVMRCKIGSPYVIAAMKQSAHPKSVGFEPNGGFLLGYDATGPAGPLPALMTRDAVLPLIAPLAAARAKGQSLRDLLRALPARATAADRLSPVSMHDAQSWLRDLAARPSLQSDLLSQIGLAGPSHVDETDGLRIYSAAGPIVHLRPSGNAPEFRIYVEAKTETAAAELLGKTCEVVARSLGQIERSSS